MEARGKNKENNPGRNMSIKEAFKVKKCLFQSNKLENTSPKPDPSIMDSPTSDMNVSLPHVESPFAMFHIKKRRSQGTFMKSLHEEFNVTPHKRSNSVKRKGEKSDKQEPEEVHMASPACTNSVKLAVQKAMTDPSLTGDFSKPCFLPTIEGRHPDLKTVTPDTVANLLNKLHEDSRKFKLIDCRYPYEYSAGHIKSAVNMYYKGNVESDFFKSAVTASKQETSDILIFYCEFSSERAPGMYRFLRNYDREFNKDCYPFLYYPELYVIEGGYRAFYSIFKDLCEPREYKPMLHKEHSEDLTHYRQLCKTWSLKSKRGKRAKMHMKFNV